MNSPATISRAQVGARPIPWPFPGAGLSRTWHSRSPWYWVKGSGNGAAPVEKPGSRSVARGPTETTCHGSNCYAPALSPGAPISGRRHQYDPEPTQSAVGTIEQQSPARNHRDRPGGADPLRCRRNRSGGVRPRRRCCAHCGGRVHRRRIRALARTPQAPPIIPIFRPTPDPRLRIGGLVFQWFHRGAART